VLESAAATCGGDVAATNSRGVEVVSKRVRFRFSLLTLLLAMAWSAVVVWMNTLVRVEGLGLQVGSRRWTDSAGWPLRYAEDIYLEGDRPFLFYTGRWYAALVADSAIGILLVVVLTWVSNQLLRRVGARLRRRSAAKLGEQQVLDSRVE
jgi:hypothetical protein